MESAILWLALVAPADDPFIAGVRLVAPRMVRDVPSPRQAWLAVAPAPRHAPRLDPDLRESTHRVTRLNMPTLDDTLPQPPRRAGPGPLSGRLHMELGPGARGVDLNGGVVEKLWRLLPVRD